LGPELPCFVNAARIESEALHLTDEMQYLLCQLDLRQCHRAMIVTVTIMLMMKVTIYKIINVVTVRHCLMSTARSVYVVSIVPIAGMPGGTVSGIGL